MGVAVAAKLHSGAATRLAQRLRAIILLGGSVRQGRLVPSIGRPIFDLPLEARSTLLEAWSRSAWELSTLLDRPLPVRVLIDRLTPPPKSAAAPLQIERDPQDYRGTGGVLRDVTSEYDPQDLVLVANAAQVLLEPLAELAQDLATANGDVAILSHADGTPTGLLLVRCGALRVVPETGFVDMKEQALPLIAAQHSVIVQERQTPTATPIRTLADYVDALRRYHRQLAGKERSSNPFAEDWEPAFSIIEAGATVNPTSRIHDSVVLAGATVEADAVVVNSVICGGATVRRGAMEVGALVAPHSNGHKKQ